MFRDEITIDDVIEFIIKHCDDRELMDKISRTSFPFTTKYLNGNKRREKEAESTITLTPNVPYTPYTYCSSNEDLPTNEE